MKRTIIYFDNAATSHPKPEEVYRAADNFLRRGGSPGRSAHELALSASRQVFETRLAVAGFLGIKAPERLIFTPGCTHSLNMALYGLDFQPGQQVLVTALEHNAVMRTLHRLKLEKGIEIRKLPYCPGQILCADELEKQLKQTRPRLCAFLEASNVTGELLDLPALAEICARYQVPMLVDAAQSAGLVQASLDLPALAFWCTSGHKGLLGVPGLGLLYVAPGTDINPLVYGGTGSRSDELEMPKAYPDHLEAGTMPGPAIAGLAAGVEFLQKTGIEKIYAHEMSLCRYFLDWLSERKDFHVVGKEAQRRTALVSFEIKDLDSSYVAELLDRDYGICLRAGLHCAASAHESLGTSERGLLRASFSYFNTREELEVLCKALESISSQLRS